MTEDELRAHGWSKDDRFQCPDCGGNGVYSGMVCGRGRWELVTANCYRCAGTGQIDTRAFEIHARGEMLARHRQALDLSLREAARKLKMPVAELSDLEHGRDAEILSRLDGLIAKLNDKKVEP